ncbi:response regulator [Azospira inquinata]|uniref:Response regulator transcription factor n=1 Tax=Azospira inquinata TaxID=2785627 RepID=A0A975SKV1_9RHOO|nr:response regulator transcription factor [Azospira inquinata]QWT46514.1 response regulator transcription factor [Azospira inquinata]QWT48162.1 response regulator transcription factor [Azospira inquinata]
MKVLIVEDSKLVSERLRLALEAQPGVQASIACRLDQALSQFRTQPPGLVILDIELPDGSGMNFLKTIKAESPRTRVAMFTNHPGFRQRCLDLGADFFFDKTVNLDTLTDTVSRLAKEEVQ